MSGNAVSQRLGPVTIEGARIIFRNFAGLEGQYNAAGDRNFGCVLPADIARQMEAQGWNIKWLKSREEGEEPTPWVPVTVSYKNRPPRVVMITTRFNRDGSSEQVRTPLPEELVSLMDFADLSSVDLILNPYQWSVRGESGVKAYLKSFFGTVQQDDLERKYASLEEVAFDGTPLQIEAEAYQLEDVIDAEVIEDSDEPLQIEA